MRRFDLVVLGRVVEPGRVIEEGAVGVKDGRSMKLNQSWFEMTDLRGRSLARSVWIPLRAMQNPVGIDQLGHGGYKSEFFSAKALTIPIEHRATAETLGWTDIGILHHHRGYVEDGEYIPADVYYNSSDGLRGIHLVLDQGFNLEECSEWHLHQDLVVTLGLKREADIWVRPDEGYVEVARLLRDTSGAPCRLDIRASHLRDYLCARGMVLHVASYWDRIEVFEDVSWLTWPEHLLEETADGDRWQGRVVRIHEGGMPYGEEVAVIHVARTDPVYEDDVPVLDPPTEDNLNYQSWTKRQVGQELYWVEGRLWRSEWIEPASASPIVRGDEVESTVYFITDAAGNRENADTLAGYGGWLWFGPRVIMELLGRRGGSLQWHTRDTGSVCCTPGHEIRFGVNSLGLINVFAPDIACLPEWQQRIWSGHNLSPDGKVSEELLAAQVRADPAKTQAPEALLEFTLLQLNNATMSALGTPILTDHSEVPSLLSRTHRFRSVDEHELRALAKDLTRLTTDRIDASALQRFASPPKGQKWGSLKSLEGVLALEVGKERARALTGPFVGIYDLRRADAHLPSKDLEKARELIGIDESAPYILQGCQLLSVCVSSIQDICAVFERWDAK